MLGNLFVKKRVVVLFSAMAFSSSFAQYEIKKQTINSGGSVSFGSNYQLSGSIGQADASNQQTGGTYSLTGGFWHENNDLIFRNEFE